MSGMTEITIKQACETDIPVVEAILLDAVNWLNEMGQPLWDVSEVSWDGLSGNPRDGDHWVSGNLEAGHFYIAYRGGEPAGCMALIDRDPLFWPDVKKGEALFLHKLAVTKAARKTGVSDALIRFAKEEGARRGCKTVRLDTDAARPKTRAFYERHGFTHVRTRTQGPFRVAFYAVRVGKSLDNGTLDGYNVSSVRQEGEPARRGSR